MQRSAIMMLGALALGACGDDGGPDGDLIASYLGTWTFDADVGGSDPITCDGQINLTHQAEEDGAAVVLGTYLIARSSLDCFHETGDFNVGVDQEGNLVGEYLPPDGDGCTAGVAELDGGLAEGALDLQGSFDVDCGTLGTFTVDVEFSGAASEEAPPSYPDLDGTYDGTWSVAVESASGTVEQSCPGTMALNVNAAGEVTGNLFFDDPCSPPITLPLMTTVVTTDGELEGEVDATDVGCTVLSEGTIHAEFSGTGDDTVTALGQAHLECSDGLGGTITVILSYSFLGTR